MDPRSNRSRSLVGLAAALLVTVTAPAMATDGNTCNGPVAIVAGLYVQSRPHGNVEYRETNDVPGLQAGGPDEIGWKADLCGGAGHDQLVTCNDRHNCILL